MLGLDLKMTRKSHLFWTFLKCYEEAKKFNRRIDWQTQSGSSYKSAQKRGWVDACAAHMAPGVVGLPKKFLK
jgi:hypothetical protein